MKINPSYHLLVIILTLGASMSTAQENNSNNSAEYLNQFHERIVMQTDRNLYFSGGKVWFKADYLLNEKTPDKQLSKVLYLQLCNEKGETVAEEKYPIHESLVSGNLSIPQDARTGNYILRASTKYQRNFNPMGFSHTSLVIVNPDIPVAGQNNVELEDILIVPEGGSWIKGIRSRLVIMIPHQLMKRTNKIDITKNRKNIQPLDPLPNGIAETYLTPTDSAKYHLKITTRGEDTLWRSFPEFSNQGMAIATQIKQHGIHYSVALKEETKIDRQNYKLEIFSDQLNKIGSEKIEFENGAASADIPFNALKHGIHYFILYNSRQKIEKITPVYAPANHLKEINIHTDKEVYNRRESVHVRLDSQIIKDDSNRLSVSVVQRGTYFNEMKHLPTIFINNPHLIPEYYHSPNEEIFRKQLEWSMILFNQRLTDRNLFGDFENLQNRNLRFYPEIRDLTLSGTLRNKDTHEPIPDIQMCFSALDGKPQFHIYQTRRDGKFIFTLSNLTGKRNIFLYPLYQSEIEGKFEILLNRNFHPEPPAYVSANLPINSTNKDLLDKMYVNWQLSHNSHDIIKEEPEEKKSSISGYFGHHKHVIHLDDYIKLDNMNEVFVELIPYVQAVQNGENYNLKVLNEQTYNRRLTSKPLIFLDNMPVFDATKVMNLHPSQVKTIEVENQSYILGEHAISGVILITTKTDNLAGLKPPKNSVFAEYQSLSKKADFQKPYNPLKETISGRPDFRTLLYWNPDADLTPAHPDISFYTSDRQGKFEIIIRGRKNGELLYGRKTITVKP